ncbi:hypothetical protein [Urbifossiella limnaea]|uniref:Uncharacterized protein n=1 Tax=Urbifossiella limnaea TaxID=2528023 RepID=A0A517XLU3_9BACT|nr:hypothetical protein [Urbifossiella limnaea]QDU18481.1 hypothetical protein ETAA1_03690 [Urbifossiella limnaea]
MTVVDDADFNILWNAAGSLAAVVAAVSEGSPRPVPRWAVLALATALRQAGVSLREHVDERPPASLLTQAKALGTTSLTGGNLNYFDLLRRSARPTAPLEKPTLALISPMGSPCSRSSRI